MRQRLGLLFERAAMLLACLTILWGPLAQGSTFTWGFSGLALLGSAVGMLAVVALALRGRLRLLHPLLLVATLLLLGWIWASVGWATYPLAAQRMAGIWTAVLGTSVCLQVLATTRRRQDAVIASMLLGAAAAVLIAWGQARGVTLPYYQALPGTPQQYLTGPYYHPSHFSGYLILPAALITTVMLRARWWWAVPLLTLQGGVQWANLQTDGSSIPAVVLAALLPVVVWAWSRRVLWGAVLTVLALGGLGSGLYLLTTSSGQSWFDAHKNKLGIQTQNLEGFLASRRAVHSFGERMWRDHPTKGVGVGQFETEFQFYRRPGNTGYIDNHFVNYAHSDYLQMLSELGLPGLMLYLLTLGFSVARSLRGNGSMAWAATLPVYLLTGIYDSHLTVIPGTMVVAFALMGLPSLPRVLSSSKAETIGAEVQA